jgi:glycosyltransferase involved in cell wall biosynthesis
MSGTLRRLVAPAKPIYRRAETEWAWLRSRRQRADVAIFHQFVPPPAGGGHQFLRGLWREFAQRGLVVENNVISPTTRALLFNSFNFDAARLRRFRRDGVRLVHRVDGPIDVYRGSDAGMDRRIQALNAEFADATIFQSHYSLRKHDELGLSFCAPSVISNSPDPLIFHARGRVAWDPNRKIRILASSWSDNPNKGAPVYEWLAAHLDWARYDFTFVGRSPVAFHRIRALPPVDSTTMAELLRSHDIYLTASLFDPCSNALLEALACGLPGIYARSGGHSELVGAGGLGFDAAEEIPALLDELVAGYSHFQAQIRVPTLAEVADRYLQVLGLAESA